MMHRVSVAGVVVLMLIVCAAGLFAQEEAPKTQLMALHTDIVKPNMVAKYEAASKNLNAKLAEHGQTDVSWVCAMTTDGQYLYVSAIENMAELDEDAFEDMAEKMGKEAMDEMWSMYEGCYDVHMNSTWTLHHDLSYNPEGKGLMEEGLLNRHLTYYYVIPGMGETARKVSEEWRDLFATHNLSHGYRIYTGGMGTEVPLFIVVEWAKGPAEYAAMTEKTNATLGEAGKKLMQKNMEICRRIESKDGWMRPDLSYMPTTQVSKK